MTAITPLHRTLEQELSALFRGVSLECLVCGEFVQHRDWAGSLSIACPECYSALRPAAAFSAAAPGRRATAG